MTVDAVGFSVTWGEAFRIWLLILAVDVVAHLIKRLVAPSWRAWRSSTGAGQ